MKKRLRGFKTFCGTAVTVLVSREGREGDNPETMLKRRMALQQTWEIHTHVDNRRWQTVQVYQCQLNACTSTSTWTNTAKYKGAQTPAGCADTSASQNPACTKKCWHRRMHWCVCITIPHTLEGTQRLFVVNSDKLNLTALIIMMYDDYNIIFTDLVIWILVSWYCIAIFNFSFIFLFCKDVWLDERFHLKARS